MKLQFKCPRCGGNRLQEKMINVVLISEITEINVDEKKDSPANLEYGYKTTDEGEVEHYICTDCDYIPVDVMGDPINDCLYLGDWIKDNCK